MTFRDRTTGEYPITLGTIRRRSSVAFGASPTAAILDAANVDPVEATTPPTPGANQTVREGEPEQFNGKWRQTWIVEPAPERVFTWLEFIDLFTSDEQIELVGASMVDANVKLFYDKAVGAQGIYLSDQRTIDGITLLANAGLLTPQRRDQVLAGIMPGSV